MSRARLDRACCEAVAASWRDTPNPLRAEPDDVRGGLETQNANPPSQRPQAQPHVRPSRTLHLRNSRLSQKAVSVPETFNSDREFPLHRDPRPLTEGFLRGPAEVGSIVKIAGDVSSGCKRQHLAVVVAGC